MSYISPQSFSVDAGFSWAWRKYRDNLGAWIGATLLIFAVGVFAGILQIVLDLDPADGITLSVVVFQLLSWLVSLVANAVLVRGALDEAQGVKLEISSALTRVPVVPILLAAIVMAVLTTIGLILLVIPGILFMILSYYSHHFIMNDGLDPIAAIMASVKLVWANFANGLLLGLLAFLTIFIGLLACGVGLLVAMPLVSLLGAWAFNIFQGRPVAP